jgi:hypothetical protein
MAEEEEEKLLMTTETLPKQASGQIVMLDSESDSMHDGDYFLESARMDQQKNLKYQRLSIQNNDYLDEEE